MSKIVFHTISSFILFINLSVVFAEENIAVMGLIGEKALLRIDGKHYQLRIGESSLDGVVLIAISSDRRGVVLEINGIEKSYRLGSGTNTTSGTAKIIADRSGLYRTEGKINGKPVSFIIDTGASHVSLSQKQAEQLAINYKQSTKTGKAETVNGIVDVHIIMLNEVEVGDIALSNVEASVHDGDFDSAVLLGMSFLKQIKIKREGDVLELSR